MKMTLNFNQFIDNWPESRKEQFSYEGKRALHAGYTGRRRKNYNSAILTID